MVQYKIIENLSVCGESLQQLIDTLPPWRREQAMNYKFEAGRRENALSYLLLCQMLKEHMGIDAMPAFIIGEHGKPSLDLQSCGTDTPPLHFNISHCKKGIACVISDDSEVGIDIECTGRYSESLSQYCMSDEENSRITQAPDADRLFTELWTRKEALLKLTGEGITDDIKNVLSSSRMDGVTITSYHKKDYVFSLAERGLRDS